jgi:hypothetical protein
MHYRWRMPASAKHVLNLFRVNANRTLSQLQPVRFRHQVTTHFAHIRHAPALIVACPLHLSNCREVEPHREQRPEYLTIMLFGNTTSLIASICNTGACNQRIDL